MGFQSSFVSLNTLCSFLIDPFQMREIMNPSGTFSESKHCNKTCVESTGGREFGLY